MEMRQRQRRQMTKSEEEKISNFKTELGTLDGFMKNIGLNEGKRKREGGGKLNDLIG